MPNAGFQLPVSKEKDSNVDRGSKRESKGLNTRLSH